MRSVHLNFKNHPLLTTLLFFCFALFSNHKIAAQISITVTGNTNTTPNLLASYPNLAAALTDVNAVTAMTGPVVLSCTGGTSETAPPTGLTLGSASLNAVLSATNTITINVSGAGAVTLNAGVGTATPASAAPDGILKLSGADYVTLDGLTFTDGNAANPATMEFGLALFKRAAGDGCNNNTIQNCTFNMQRINNATATTPMIEGSVGILVINSTSAAATTSLTPTNGGTLATNGTNSGNKFYGNTINGGNYGIGLSGFAASTGVGPTPTATTFLGDLGNDIGSVSGNMVLNFGGGATTSPAAGIRANNQWSAIISNNTVNNNNGSGFNHATTLRGIYAQAGTSGNVTIENNIVSLQSGATTSDCRAIDNGIGSTALSNTVSIRDNMVSIGYSTATSGVYIAINNTSSAATVNINRNTINQISGVALAGTGTHVMIETGSPTNATANTNTILNITRNGASGNWRGIKTTSPTNFTCNDNTIDGLSWTLAASTGSIDAIYSFSSAVNVTANNNIIRNLSTPATGTITGINEFGASGLKTFKNNQIYSFSTTAGGAGGATFRGISESTGTTNDISGNLIYSLNSTGTTGGTGGTIVGITFSSGTTNNIYKNKIYDLSSTSTNPTVSGISATGGTTSNIYNNIIGDLRTPAANAANPLIGLNLTGGTTVNAYYNTVYINGSSSGALFGSSAVSVSTSPTVTLRNNIFVNTSTVNGAAFAAAHRRSGTSLTSYASASNNNLFYSGTPSATNVIFYDGTNNDQTMSAYKTRVAARDAASVTENVAWQSTTGSNANFLKYNTGSASQIESGAANIATFTDDYAGTIRQGNMGYAGTGVAPDMGAWELEGIAADFTGPVITYTALGSTSCNTDRTISGVTITDASMVNISGGTRPRLYYKKSTNANTYADNTNATDGWKYVEATGVGGSPFSFTTDFTLLFGGAPTTGDVIQYFIVAQDQAGTPNVGINSGTFTANPTSVALTAAAFPLTGTINSYNQVAAGISGTKTVGATGDYTSLTIAGGLFDVINTGGISGNLTVNLLDASISETGAIALNAINYNGCAAGPYTVTIKPNTAVATVLTGAVGTGAILKLNGADFVTIDGSNSGGTDRSLTIRNTTSTTSGNAVIWLASPASGNGATNNTIKNCIVEGNSATTTFTCVHIGGSTTIGLTTAGTELNSNNTINNNLFRKTQYGATLFGFAAASPDLNNTISNNNFGTAVAGEGFSLIGINADRQQGLVVSGNEVQNITNGGTFASNLIGIRLLDFKNGLAFNNKVHSISYTGTSTAKLYGIAVSSSSYTTVGNPSNATIYNNTVSNLTSSGTSTTWNISGIFASQGYNDKYYYNTVNLGGQLCNSSSGLVAAFANGDPWISSTAVINIDVRNNIFNVTGSSLLSGGNFWATYTTATTLAGSTLNYNALNCAGTNATNNIGRFNSVNYTTLATWQSGSGQEANSFVEAPVFVSATDAHLNMGLANTRLEQGGVVIAGINTDIDGNTRPGPAGSINGGGTIPDVGADEFDGVPAVAMSYTSSTTDQVSGAAYAGVLNQAILRIKVVTSGVLSPISATSFTLNANGTTNIADINAATAKVYYTGASTTFSTATLFGSTTPTIANYTVAGTQTLLTGDNYFWVAYDVTAGAMNNNLIDGECVSITVGSAQTPTVTAPMGNKVISGPMSGTYLIGSAQTFPNFTTITSAVSDLNGRGVSGPVTFRLVDANYSTNETFPIVINAITGASASNTITILPSTGVNATITGSTAATALIKLNGSDYITIDGSNSGGTDKSLTITNTATSAPCVIWMASLGAGLGAESNTVKNCILNASAATASTAYGISISGSTIGSAGADNDNTTILNNTINSFNIGVYANGSGSTSSGGLDNLIVSSNAFTTNSTTGDVYGVKLGNSLTTSVTTNSFNLTTSTTTAPVAISLETGVSASSVTSNQITQVNATNTGGYAGRGITIGTGTASSSITVANNFIAGVNGSNWNAFGNSSSMGIAIGIIGNSSTLTTTAGGINLYHNSINMTGSMGSGSTTALTTALYIGSGASALNIKNNIFVNTQVATSTTQKNYGIYSAAANTAFTDINNNDYYVSNSFNAGSAILGFLTSDRTNIAAWQSATGQDANSVNIAPVFVSSTNLHLDTGSNTSLNNLGTPVAGVTTDIDGNTRDVTNPDMGADEFTPVTCVTAVGGMASGSTSLCATGTPTITASGYSTGSGSTYQWYFSTNIADYPNAGSMVSGQTTPSAVSTGVVSTTTYFWLRVTCGTDMSTDNSTLVTIIVNPKPVVSATNDGPKCVGSTLTLSGTHDIGTTFNWTGPNSFTSTNQNPTISNVTLAASGTYSFTATSAVGCTSDPATTVPTINSVPSALSVSPASTLLCPSSPAQLLTATGGTISNSIILSETFNAVTAGTTTSGNLPGGWTGNSLTSGVRIWGVVATGYSSGTLGGGNFLYCESDSYSAFQTRSQVITPAFNASNYSTLNFKFKQYYNDLTAGAASDSARVYVSNDGGTNWVLQQAYDADQGTAFSGAGAVNTTIAINAVPFTSNMKIKLVYNSDLTGNDWYWAIDDVVIDGSLNPSLVWTPITGLYTDAGAMSPYTGTGTNMVFAKPTSTQTYTVTASTAATFTYNGNITESGWGAALATSAGGPTPGFGAGHEVNAVYAQASDTHINLGLAGNVQDGNRILLFIDSKSGGYNDGNFGRTSAPQGVDDFNSATTFDSGFNADYCLVIGTNAAGDNNFFDLFTLSGTAGMGGGPSTYLGDRFTSFSGAFTGANPANSNNTQGFEVGIPKSLLGYTSGGVKVFAMYTSDGGFLSNQFLTKAGAADGNYGGGAVVFGAAMPDPVTLPSANLNNYCTTTGTATVQVEGTVVKSSADAGFNSLRSVYNCISEGGTITYDQPTTVTTVLTAPLNITKSVTIQGLSNVARPEITIPSGGMNISDMKTLTLENVDVKSTATDTFTGTGTVEIKMNATTVIKQ